MMNTSIDWFIESLPERFKNAILNTCQEEIEIARAVEKQRMTDAIMYSLDEDGHTGDWKIKFANDYINKLFSNAQDPAHQ